MPKTDPYPDCKTIADWYSENGKDQVLVAVYQHEALVYLQVSEATGAKVWQALAALPHIERVGAARSADGLTYVMRFGRSRTNPGTGDWLSVFMGTVSSVLVLNLPGLVNPDGVNYTDCRWRDACTVERFAALLREIPPAPNVSTAENPTKP